MQPFLAQVLDGQGVAGSLEFEPWNVSCFPSINHSEPPKDVKTIGDSSVSFLQINDSETEPPHGFENLYASRSSKMLFRSSRPCKGMWLTLVDSPFVGPTVVGKPRRIVGWMMRAGHKLDFRGNDISECSVGEILRTVNNLSRATRSAWILRWFLQGARDR